MDAKRRWHRPAVLAVDRCEGRMGHGLRRALHQEIAAQWTRRGFGKRRRPMTSVFVDVGMSLDGFIAGPNRGPANPQGDGGVDIHQWVFRTATFLERLGAGGGERSADDAVVRAVFDRAGAYVMGRRMFDEGEVGWPEDAPFRAPGFVLAHSARALGRKER